MINESGFKESLSFSVQELRMRLRIFISLTCIMLAISVNDAAEPTFADKFKRIFTTPTPPPHTKKKATAAKRKSPTPTPSPKSKASPPNKQESPARSAIPKQKRTPSAEAESPTASPSFSPYRKKGGSPTPRPSGSEESPSPTPSATPEESPSPSKEQHVPNATLLPNQIKGFETYPLKVQKLLVSALELTTRNLDYKYGSSDPANGGMDCSGFVYYVLKQNDIADVPRDSSGQYIWLRRAREFESVLSEKDDSFELEDLKPGDLLFWTGTYLVKRDPPITHAMIYLGREKKTGQRVMVGASDGRVFQGESRYGVSVFDFKIQCRETNGDGKLRPTFIGYGHLPGLQQ